MDILKFSKQIKKEANQMLKLTNIRNLLKPFGEFKIVGSYDLDLMFYKDIDMVVITSEKPSITQLQSIITDIARKVEIVDQSYENNFILRKEWLPQGVYLGFKFMNDWTIDTWFMGKEEFEYRQRIINNIFENYNEVEHQEEIIDLKKKYYEQGVYGKPGYTSMDVYRSVLKNK